MSSYKEQTDPGSQKPTIPPPGPNEGHSSPYRRQVASLFNSKARMGLLASVPLLWLALCHMACGVPPVEDNPSYTLKPSAFRADNLLETPQVVDCTLEDGTQTKCYKLRFKSNPHGHGGPYCPKTDKDIGGLGIYDGKTNPGFQVLKATLWQSMANDGFDVVDSDGNVKIVDPGAGMAGGPPPGGDPPTGAPPPGGMPPGGTPGGSGPGAACLEASPNDDLALTYLLPVTPKLLDSPNTIERVELIGVSSAGVPINGPPPTVAGDGGGRPGGGGAIPALDPCGGHMDPAGYYHWHFGAQEMNKVLMAKGIDEVSCKAIVQSSTIMLGYAKDGHPIYASNDKDGSTPTDLDQCQGHTAPTAEYPDGIYHYHVSTTGAPNLPTCLKGAAAQQPFTRE